MDRDSPCGRRIPINTAWSHEVSVIGLLCRMLSRFYPLFPGLPLQHRASFRLSPQDGLYHLEIVLPKHKKPLTRSRRLPDIAIYHGGHYNLLCILTSYPVTSRYTKE